MKQKEETVILKTKLKSINEIQLKKIKNSLKYSLDRLEFNEKYQGNTLKPGIYFFKCF
jgi:hypothetical protein